LGGVVVSHDSARSRLCDIVGVDYALVNRLSRDPVSEEASNRIAAGAIVFSRRLLGHVAIRTFGRIAYLCSVYDFCNRMATAHDRGRFTYQLRVFVSGSRLACVDVVRSLARDAHEWDVLRLGDDGAHRRRNVGGRAFVRNAPAKRSFRVGGTLAFQPRDDPRKHHAGYRSQQRRPGIPGMGRPGLPATRGSNRLQCDRRLFDDRETPRSRNLYRQLVYRRRLHLHFDHRNYGSAAGLRTTFFRSF
jgi:hypothetical protein